ncbi:1,4-dihydroxy-2-naphthoate octaprenyltransferase [Tengunoibacter tsumagoiensis]|uniref:1,4-dihydroxy-2-naphthoate octaprenyltransferase n=1 Tax=Tengunoibacter tsumagoiensis TaxID=2014871 RepID=A0A401ZVG3_9CHLR|nr:1,4-dihydroxy-2-naphthoate octaprenyltransferase [Tengunoibacter tsumagoiensis]GCE10918.1 hypothetical protein KTT_07770 [Tengunoibacter tsumagoiensis]
MEQEEQAPQHLEKTPDYTSDQTREDRRSQAATQVVAADAVGAEEVPTIPIGSLQTINALQPEVSVHSVASMFQVQSPTPLVVQPEEYRLTLGEQFQIWRDGLRPAYLPLALLPVVLGSVLAWVPTVTAKRPLGQFAWTPFIGAILVALFLQFGANLLNDYYDYLRGIDTSNQFAPGGLIQQRLIKPKRILTSSLLLFAIGSVLGIFVALRGGGLVFLFGLLAIAAAYFYSATSRPLATLGFGPVIAFIVFGPLATLSSNLIQSAGHLTNSAFLYSLLPGLLAAVIIHTNDLRDLEEDAQAKKRTPATLLGLQGGRWLFLLLVLSAYVLVVLLGFPNKAPHWILLALWTLPTLVVAITGIFRTDNPAGFHTVMRQMLSLETAFILLLVAGLIINTLIPVLPHIPEHLIPGI